MPDDHTGADQPRYKLVTLDTLAAAKGVELQNGVTYYGFSDADIEAGHISDEGE